MHPSTSRGEDSEAEILKLRSILERHRKVSIHLKHQPVVLPNAVYTHIRIRADVLILTRVYVAGCGSVTETNSHGLSCHSVGLRDIRQYGEYNAVPTEHVICMFLQITSEGTLVTKGQFEVMLTPGQYFAVVSEIVDT